VRWLAGVNESGGKTYLNKEQFEELWGWLQVPVLVAVAERKASAGSSRVEVEIPIAAACETAREAGYELGKFLELWGMRDGRETVSAEEPSVSQ